MARARESDLRLALAAAAAGMIVGALTGCTRPIYDPDLATRPYPRHLHTTSTLDMHVFRAGQHLEVVNSTARSYRDFDLWVNQRYMKHIEAMEAGQTLRLSLWEFHDELGESPVAGGFWRTEEPTPVRLVEIQPTPDGEMIGLITIRADEVEVRRP